MHYFLYPTRDAFITNHPTYMYKNTGLDEILEVEKRTSYYACGANTGSLGSVLSRALLHFNLNQISEGISSGQIPVNARYYLNLKICESVEIPTSYTLAAYPVSGSWSMGTGYKYDGQSVSDGVNWKYRDGKNDMWWTSSLASCDGGGTWWVSASLAGSGSGYAQEPFVSPNPYDPYPNCPDTGSPAPSGSPVPPVTGGFACSQSFDYQSSDVRMDVTTIVNAWLSGSIPNYGLIVMHSDETSSIDYGQLRFFSKETNTIYSPYIDVAWYDATFDTGSTEPIQIRDSVVTMKNMSKEYKFGSLVRMDVTARKRYPIKTFTNRLSDYLEPYYLPSSSFYTIRDAESEEDVIPYDGCTRLSFDQTGNYFMLDTTGLPQERYFKVQIRTEQSGSILTFDIPTAFKITR